jgi:hypothetical protein
LPRRTTTVARSNSLADHTSDSRSATCRMIAHQRPNSSPRWASSSFAIACGTAYACAISHQSVAGLARHR